VRKGNDYVDEMLMKINQGGKSGRRRLLRCTVPWQFVWVRLGVDRLSGRP